MYLSTYYVNVHMLMVLFLLTSGGLGLNCPFPMTWTDAFVVNCLILGCFTEVLSAKTAEQNVSAILS